MKSMNLFSIFSPAVFSCVILAITNINAQQHSCSIADHEPEHIEETSWDFSRLRDDKSAKLTLQEFNQYSDALPGASAFEQAAMRAERNLKLIPIVLHIAKSCTPKNFDSVSEYISLSYLNSDYDYVTDRQEFEKTVLRVNSDFRRVYDYHAQRGLFKKKNPFNFFIKDVKHMTLNDPSLCRPYMPIIDTAKLYQELIRKKFVENALNIYIIDGFGTAFGFSPPPWYKPLKSGIVLSMKAAQDPEHVIHEIGHYFGLHHPFYKGPLPVNSGHGLIGTITDPSCHTRGDGICDTPEDTKPKKGESKVLYYYDTDQEECFIDYKDEVSSYYPESKTSLVSRFINYMSYYTFDTDENDPDPGLALSECRQLFSRGQLELMENVLRHRASVGHNKVITNIIDKVYPNPIKAGQRDVSIELLLTAPHKGVSNMLRFRLTNLKGQQQSLIHQSVRIDGDIRNIIKNEGSLSAAFQFNLPPKLLPGYYLIQADCAKSGPISATKILVNK